MPEVGDTALLQPQLALRQLFYSLTSVASQRYSLSEFEFYRNARILPAPLCSRIESQPHQQHDR
jgi:hypothetical protein